MLARSWRHSWHRPCEKASAACFFAGSPAQQGQSRVYARADVAQGRSQTEWKCVAQPGRHVRTPRPALDLQW